MVPTGAISTSLSVLKEHGNSEKKREREQSQARLHGNKGVSCNKPLVCPSEKIDGFLCLCSDRPQKLFLFVYPSRVCLVVCSLISKNHMKCIHSLTSECWEMHFRLNAYCLVVCFIIRNVYICFRNASHEAFTVYWMVNERLFLSDMLSEVRTTVKCPDGSAWTEGTFQVFCTPFPCWQLITDVVEENLSALC